MDFIRTANIVWERGFHLGLVNALIDDEGVATPLAGLKAKFFKGASVPTPDSALAGFTPDLAALGTAGLDVVWTGPITLPGDRQGLKAEVQALVDEGEPVSETITGIILLNTAMDEYVGGFRFEEPAEMSLPGDGISVDVVAGIPLQWESGF